MTLNKFMEEFAREIGGQYSLYDINKSVVIVPLKQNRFQAVMAIESNGHEKGIYQFTSRICGYNQKIDLKELLKNNVYLYYSKFFIDDEVLRVMASASKDVSNEVLKEMIMEVANTADEWENKLTGLDVN
jgi:hypothetical protein